MEAKDTVMNDTELLSWHLGRLESRKAIALAQAEISFPAGYEQGFQQAQETVDEWLSVEEAEKIFLDAQ